MDWTDFHEFFRLIEDDNLSLFYRGDFADDITIRLIDLSESHFKKGKEQMSLKKKVSFLMAECFQNVIRYGEELTSDHYLQEQTAYFMTRNAKGKARIRTQISAAHTRQDLDIAIAAFAKTYAELTAQ